MSSAEPSSDPDPGVSPWLSFAVGATIVVLSVILIAIIRDDDEPPVGEAATGATAQRARPTATSPARLVALSKRLKQPIYWIGPQPGRTYELTRTEDGLVFLRYLDRAAKVGDPRPRFLTIGSYPQPDPLATVAAAAKRDGAQVEKLEDGGMAVADRSEPRSWYVAFPESGQLVEVFAPQTGRARALLEAGRVVPVDP